MRSTFYLLMLLAIQDQSCGQSITALKSTEHATESETVTLSCKYDSQARSLHWYRQYPGSRPQFLLLVFESGTVTHAEPRFPRLEGSVNKVDKRVDLIISSAAGTDSAVYYCALEPTVTGNTHTPYKNLMMLRCVLLVVSATQYALAQSIRPLQNIVPVTEGELVTLSCKYNGSANSLHWYRQYPGSRPEFVLLVLESSTEHVTYAVPRIPGMDGRMSMSDKRVDLIISSASVSDSALYYCALEPTVTGNTHTPYNNLRKHTHTIQ
ncbi:uncharacterized protein [Pseudorasbora parva]|uniref:uncharacterized protein n=1 Tax=Pseudorasbora parva TaxID=51549 RepID=UPI00351EE283